MEPTPRKNSGENPEITDLTTDKLTPNEIKSELAAALGKNFFWPDRRTPRHVTEFCATHDLAQIAAKIQKIHEFDFTKMPQRTATWLHRLKNEFKRKLFEKINKTAQKKFWFWFETAADRAKIEKILEENDLTKIQEIFGKNHLTKIQEILKENDPTKIQETLEENYLTKIEEILELAKFLPLVDDEKNREMRFFNNFVPNILGGPLRNAPLIPPDAKITGDNFSEKMKELGTMENYRKKLDETSGKKIQEIFTVADLAKFMKNWKMPADAKFHLIAETYLALRREGFTHSDLRT